MTEAVKPQLTSSRTHEARSYIVGAHEHLIGSLYDKLKWSAASGRRVSAKVLRAEAAEALDAIHRHYLWLNASIESGDWNAERHIIDRSLAAVAEYVEAAEHA